MKAPVSVCIIVKNEPLLEESIQSIRPYVEEIVIVDTGSTDANTIAVGKKYADIYESYNGCNDPNTGLIEDFSNARQRSFELATQPYLMWQDADDIVVGGENLPNIVDFCNQQVKELNLEAIAILFKYEYSYNEKGQCTCSHYRERLISNKKYFSWRNPVHEVLCPIDGAKVNLIQREEVVFKHKRQYSNKPMESGRNLRILKKYVEKVGDNDARQLYYIGLEYANAGMIKESIESLTNYINVSGWPDEVVMACLKLCEIYQGLQDFKSGIKWAFKAIEVKENWAEGYFALARMFYFLGLQGGHDERRNWEKCAHFATLGLSLPPTQTVLFLNPVERDCEIHKYLSFALNKIGNVRGAYESIKIGLKSQPDDASLLFNKKVYEEFLMRQEIMNTVVKLKELGTINEGGLQLINSIIHNQEIKFGSRGTANTIQKVEESAPQMTISKTEISFEPESPFPIANVSESKDLWSIPNVSDFESMPIKMSDDQLQAVVIMVWKQFMLHDEVLSAISFLENAPYNVRHSFITEKALKLTKDSLSWFDNHESFVKANAPEDVSVESGCPIPGKLIWSEGHRFDLIANHLPPNSTLVDFGSMDGCFVNRYGLLGHKCVGLDACESSVALANKKAAEFNTGAKFVSTYFQESEGKVENNYFEYATSSDTYEHLKDPVNDMLIPAKSMLKDDGKFLLVTPYGSWMRGNYKEWAHPWNWTKDGTSWLHPMPRRHVVAPTQFSVAKHLRDAGYWVKDCYADLCDSSFANVKGQGNIFAEAWKKLPAGYDSGLDIVVFVGDGVEDWTPQTVKKTGIGGSELMAMEMSKRLVALGHKVRVYNKCGEHGEGIYDGVEYRKTEKYQDLECDVLIVSRKANMLADQFNVKAKVKTLWVHDVCAISATNEVLLKADKILALSEWHKQNIVTVHNVHPDHVVKTRNGIDISRFENKNIQRDRFKCVNSSSPDRSWPILLTVWPEIKKQVPEATLHLYYGFKNWEYSAQWDKGQQDLIVFLKNQIQEMAPLGVVYHDRVSQDELANEFLSAGCWLYPTWFTETSCISAMEAQLAGLRIVTSPIAALNETVGERGVMIPGAWTDEDYKRGFIKNTVAALKYESNDDRHLVQQYAKNNFSLDSLANDWDKMFRNMIDNKRQNPINPYMPTIKYR
jgi:glycosyltransferase involved in cell wall biosynthesis/2-polyprenyl-3-methyl-5-hydroxy-6-metoxy-1,4-benzoquinol methylase